ncbi:MAG: hypothetical protein GXY74_03815 [Phycisphaerae bacterium]|nr:hypothetical protein [Phycisphaerae bacterium]
MGGRYYWAAEVYTVGGVSYDAMTGRSLAPDYGELRHERYLATRQAGGGATVDAVPDAAGNLTATDANAEGPAGAERLQSHVPFLLVFLLVGPLAVRPRSR